jgi:hypothetical protein
VAELRKKPERLSWFRWSNARAIANSRLPQASAFIPAIGYAMLWSDDFSRWIGSTEKLGDGILISSLDARLQFLWWGAIFMTVGWLVFVFRCPKVIRRCREPDDYVLEQMQLQNMSALALVCGEIEKRLEQEDHFDKDALRYGGVTNDELLNAVVFAPNTGKTLFNFAGANYVDVIYRHHFYIEDHQKPWWRFCAVSFLFLGGGLFLWPSADVFLRVLRKLLGLE